MPSTGPSTRSRRIEAIPRAECLELLARGTVGRVSVVVGGHPHVMPVNYALDGEAVVFRTDDGIKLEGSARSPVAFEIDGIDLDEQSGWSVVVDGVAEVVSGYDPQRLERLRSLPDPWPSGEKAHVVRIAPLSISGRRVVAGD